MGLYQSDSTGEAPATHRLDDDHHTNTAVPLPDYGQTYPNMSSKELEANQSRTEGTMRHTPDKRTMRNRWICAGITFFLLCVVLPAVVIAVVLSVYHHHYSYYLRRNQVVLALDRTSWTGNGHHRNQLGLNSPTHWNTTPTTTFELKRSASALCGCYQVSADGGGAPGLYQEYVLQDYRPYSPNSGPPPLVASDTGTQGVTDPFFASVGFTNDFQISDYSHPASDGHPVLDSFSKGNVYLGRDNNTSPGYITLRTSRQAAFQSSAEIASNFKFMYGSARVMARIRGAGGAVASTFFYANDDCETDTEMMTNEASSMFHATNQPSWRDGVSVTGATKEVHIGGVPTNTSWSEWNVWGMDWTESGVVWTVNGKKTVSNSVNNPNEPMTFLMNVWSDGGSWSGGMNVGQAAWMDVQYFHLAYNTSTSGSCAGAPVCAVPAV